MADGGELDSDCSLLEEVEVVIVCYRSRPLVEELLTGWPDQLRIALVDNSGNTDGLCDYAEALPRIRYVDGGGQGFARAANRAAFSSDRTYVVFVNPDARPDVSQLEALVWGLARDLGAASHAALTTTEGGIDLGSGWEPSVARTAIHALGLHKIWPRAGLFARPARDRIPDLDWTAGDCMAVRTDQFRWLGGFDDAFFLYSEDVGFGRRAHGAGLRTVLRGDVLVPHVRGTSGAPELEMSRVRGASFAHYVVRGHSLGRATAMRALLVAGYSARMVLRTLNRDWTRVRMHEALVRGLITRRAEVNGVEVSRARYDEVQGRSRST